ncbi:MAG TPA: hypothetical protein VG735_11730 [Caulobacterales bacterium]|nr:hypothetical protein [Caulobacterales bacterium]
MAETELVEVDVEKGRSFVQKLDEAGVNVVAAYCYYYADSDRWRLAIVSPDAARGSRDLYLKALEIGAEIDLTKVEFVPTTNSVYRAIVGGGIMSMPGLGVARISRSMFNGTYIDEAIFYRMRPA